jgi:radical SAM superfamily enzyme YgiQ (UPF0313 family)
MIKTALISFLTTSINIRLLSSYLKKSGYDVTCFFCPVEYNEKNIKELIGIIKQKDINLIGISLGTDNYRSAVTATKEIKSKLGLPVIWGGAHVNVKPDESLRHADMLCMGEGEEALLELVENMSNDGGLDKTIKNIWFKTNGGIIKNELGNMEESLDKYPFSDFDLQTQYVMNENGFENLQERHFAGEYSIMTTRGCPYKCKYCYNNYRWDQYAGKGRYLRMRSIERVIEELSHAKKIFKGLRKINFWDDSFLVRKKSDYLEFKKLYTKEINLPFFALAEPMAFDNEKIKILRESGLVGLQLGIQSGSERVNKEIYHRPISNKRVLEVVNYMKELGIRAMYDFIFNNPYETRDDVLETIKLLLKFPQPISLQGYNLIFYPGTDITDNALKDGFISLKTEGEDFSTIQSAADSPISKGGGSSVSGRFYAINYSSKEKEYLNSVVSLFAYKYIPASVVKFFGSSEVPYKRTLLKMLIASYFTAIKVKHFLRHPK